MRFVCRDRTKTILEAPTHELELAHAQLGWKRGRTRYFQERFFADTRYTATGVVAPFVLGFWAVPEAFLLIPVAALPGANQTAFDASHLFMARGYAASLETEINSAMRRQILTGLNSRTATWFRCTEDVMWKLHSGPTSAGLAG